MGVVENTPTWFVMRDLNRPNALSPSWKTLPGMGFEVFTPLRTRIVMRKGVPVREALPVVNDLLFVSPSEWLLSSCITAAVEVAPAFIDVLPEIENTI